jgi:hypothetical protein
MKLEAPANANYAAVVVEISRINELKADGPGKKDCDNVVGTPLLGYQAIVSKDTKVGDIGIVFPAETQLSADFCKYNNLYSKSELNADPTAKGYISQKNRVRAVKFRGHRSDALFMPLTSLLALNGVFESDLAELKPGDVFDKFLGNEVCRKYVIKEPRSRVEKNKLAAKSRRVDEKFLPRHFDTDNYFRNKDSLAAGIELIVTAKLHGTSVRLGNVPVKRELKWYERLAKRFGVNVQEWEHDYIAGSRRVIKDPKDNDQNHYYATDVWTSALSLYKDAIPEGYVLYGELVGWVGDKPIQPKYTYGIPTGVNMLYVYRIAHINPQGFSVDLSWDQVKEFCKDRGLQHVPEFGRFSTSEFEEAVDDYLDIRFADELPYADCPVLDAGLVDEGVCIRVDGLVPYILKAKSPKFLEHETKLLDEAEKARSDGEDVTVDMESES